MFNKSSAVAEMGKR